MCLEKRKYYFLSLPLFLALCLNPCCTIKHVRHLVLGPDRSPAPLPAHPPCHTPELPILQMCHSLSRLCCFPSVICSASHPFPSGKFLSSLMAQEHALSSVMFSYPHLRGTRHSQATSDTSARSLLDPLCYSDSHICFLATCGLPAVRDLVLVLWLYPVPRPQ